MLDTFSRDNTEAGKNTSLRGVSSTRVFKPLRSFLGLRGLPRMPRDILVWRGFWLLRGSIQVPSSGFPGWV